MEYSRNESTPNPKFFNSLLLLLGIFTLGLPYLVSHPLIWQIWTWRFIGIVLIVISIQDAYVALRFCISMRRPFTSYAVGEWTHLYWISGYDLTELTRYYAAANAAYIKSLEAEMTSLDRRCRYLKREIERLDGVRVVCFERLERAGFKRDVSTEEHFALIERMLDANQPKRAMALVRRLEAAARLPTEPAEPTTTAPPTLNDCELDIRNAHSLLARYERLPLTNRSPRLDELQADIARHLQGGSVKDRAFRKTCHTFERLLDSADV